MVKTTKTVNGQALSYEIFEDGYEIYLDSKVWIRQIGKYGKPMDKEKSYEENCLLQIEELTAEPEELNKYGLTAEQVAEIEQDYRDRLAQEVRNDA